MSHKVLECLKHLNNYGVLRVLIHHQFVEKLNLREKKLKNEYGLGKIRWFYLWSQS
jgi:hypothetical protein